MKKFKKSLSITLTIALLLTLTSPVTNADAKAKVKLNRTKVSMFVGNYTTLKLKNNNKKVKWLSSNKKVATVTTKGKVKAKKAGSAKITAKVGKKKYVCKVSVVKSSDSNDKSSTLALKKSESLTPVPTATPTPTTKWSNIAITLDKTELVLHIGDKYTFTPTVTIDGVPVQREVWFNIMNIWYATGNMKTDKFEITALHRGETIFRAYTREYIGNQMKDWTADCKIIVID